MDPRSDLRPPRVLFVTPECAPLTKTGGLGDVSASLPAALHADGVDVRVLMPGYREVLNGVDVASSQEIDLLGKTARLLQSRLPTGVPLYVLDCPELYVREGGPYQDRQGADRPDNALRFGVLSKAAALLGGGGSPLGWRPDVVHCNDWPAALAPVFLRLEKDPASSLLTVHNLAFQGNFAPDWLPRLELPESFYSIETLEFYGRLSFLKGGLACADAITTVSPTYAREIQGEALGCGLDGLLRHRRADLLGVRNGIDLAIWDPARDPLIARRYDAATLEGKRANKVALQQRFGLAVVENVPLLGMVGRLTQQKGGDLVAAAADELLASPAQLVVLGSGERELERTFAALAARHPGSAAAHIGFNEGLAHLIEAGADMFVMPSRYEPCGLNQMYSQRYGTPPVVRRTGGLVDTVEDEVTGFSFESATPEALLQALDRALAIYRQPQAWRAMQRAGMARDFSWAEPARRYADLYLRLASLRQRA